MKIKYTKKQITSDFIITQHVIQRYKQRFYVDYKKQPPSDMFLEIEIKNKIKKVRPRISEDKALVYPDFDNNGYFFITQGRLVLTYTKRISTRGDRYAR